MALAGCSKQMDYPVQAVHFGGVEQTEEDKQLEALDGSNELVKEVCEVYCNKLSN